jgi:carbonic anhydrase
MRHVRSNPSASFRPESIGPLIDRTAYVHPLAAVIGDVEIGSEVMVAPGASIRADEGSPFFIGAHANVQDGVVIHALETHGEHKITNTFEVEGTGNRYSVYVGARVSLAHQAQLHGPVVVEDDSFVGMQAFVFRSRVGKGVVIEPGAKLMGVTVESGRYVPAGMIVNSQDIADGLPVIDNNYPMRGLNAEVVKVNCELARVYLASEGE